MEAEEYRESGRRLGEILDEAVIRDANQKAEMDIEAAGTKTLERLHQLVQKGYRPDFDMQFVGAVWLHHPSKNFKHDLLFLYPDGCVKSAGKTDEFRFGRNEDVLFQKFLWSVPQPTFWDRTREGRMSVVAWIIIGSVTIGSGLLVYAAVHFFG
jgi:hypothetical protein